MELSDVFDAVAYKRLAAVEIYPEKSNQHELNGVSELREFFKTDNRIEGSINWHYFRDDEEALHDSGQFTFYDARKNHETRTEWRFYYSGEFLKNVRPDDLLIMVDTGDGEIHGLIFRDKSNWFRSAKILFELNELQQPFKGLSQDELSSQKLEFAQKQILQALDISLPSRESDREIVKKQFGQEFPTTKEMSRFAREQIEVDPNNPDRALTRWIDREEELFRALEEIIVEQKLDEGFESVDEFVSFSLSVHNRRKTRMGFAFENHLEALWNFYDLEYDRKVTTENKNEPDFLFPGGDAYHDPDFNSDLLVMLGVKSTCKDRWRQILTEADRIEEKHLCTLETGISEPQTEEMKTQKVSLVLPEELHETYTERQLQEIMPVSEFIDFVEHKQNI